MDYNRGMMSHLDYGYSSISMKNAAQFDDDAAFQFIFTVENDIPGILCLTYSKV